MRFTPCLCMATFVIFISTHLQAATSGHAVEGARSTTAVPGSSKILPSYNELTPPAPAAAQKTQQKNEATDHPTQVVRPRSGFSSTTTCTDRSGRTFSENDEAFKECAEQVAIDKQRIYDTKEDQRSILTKQSNERLEKKLRDKKRDPFDNEPGVSRTMQYKFGE